jgi:hypothetical protein
MANVHFQNGTISMHAWGWSQTQLLMGVCILVPSSCDFKLLYNIIYTWHTLVYQSLHIQLARLIFTNSNTVLLFMRKMTENLENKLNYPTKWSIKSHLQVCYLAML